jgi:hypothetical protein
MASVFGGPGYEEYPGPFLCRLVAEMKASATSRFRLSVLPGMMDTLAPPGSRKLVGLLQMNKPLGI